MEPTYLADIDWQIRDAALDKTIADTFPASDPPSTLPNPHDLGLLNGGSPAVRLARPGDIPAAFVAAWNARDPDALAALFDEDAEFVNVTGLWWHSREQIRAAHAYGLSRIFQDSSLRAADVRVRHLADDVAVVHARLELTGQTPVDGVPVPRPRSTVMSFVAHLTPSGWRCASAQNTDVVPGTETNIADEAGRLRAVSYRDARVQ